MKHRLEHMGELHKVSAIVRRFALLVLVLASFCLMLLGKADNIIVEHVGTGVADISSVLVEQMARPAAVVSDAVNNMLELAHIRLENVSLREKNMRLLKWQAAARKLEAQNIQLRNILNFVPAPESSYITGLVIADTGGAFAHSFISNVGKVHGVKKGHAVITGYGLVGRIAMTGKKSSRILLVTDINSRIPVLVENTRAKAVLSGDNTKQPLLMYLGRNAQVSIGDRIVTSGHAGAFPSGLPVGIVSSINDREVRVRLFMNRSRLEYVRIVDYNLSAILQDIDSDKKRRNKR